MITGLKLCFRSMQKQSGLFFLFIVLVSLPVVARASLYHCPDHIIPLATTIGELPNPWQVYTKPLKLKAMSAGFSDGHPSDMAFLKPFGASQINNKRNVRWQFEGSYPGGKWLYCNYDGGVIFLVRELPESISECTIEYEKTSNNGQESPHLITCK